MKKCLDITEIKFSDYQDVIRVLNDYFPECIIVETPKWELGLHKYSFEGFIILEYFNQLYKVNLEGIGNGGWQGVNECCVTSILEVKSTKIRTLEVKEYLT